MTVRSELRGPVLRLTIDREERRNAFSAEVIDGLVEGLSRDDARVVVITGAGERAFCAGGDLGGFSSGESPLARNLHAEDLREGVHAFFEKRAPVWKDR